MINKEKLQLLHSIRGFAALIVVIGHAKFHFWSGGTEYLKVYPMDTWSVWDYLVFTLDMLTSNPALMVIIFFVLSGFFIAYSYESNNWKISNFYVNRSIRIYVPYLGSVIATIILFWLATVINPEIFFSSNPREFNQGLVESYQNFNLKTLGWSMIFVSKPVYIGYNDPYWSLLIEAMFYVVAPYFIKRPRLFLIISSALMLLGLFFKGFLSQFIPFAPLTVFLTVYAVFFALGYFVYWLLFKYRIQDRIRKINVWYFNVPALIILLFAMYGSLFTDPVYTYIAGGIFTSIMIYRMIIYPVKITFIHRFFISLGKISYSMYLIHFPFFILLYAILVRLTGQEVFYSRIYWIPVAIAVLVSYPYYYVVEYQSLKLIRWYKNYLKRRNASGAR